MDPLWITIAFFCGFLIRQLGLPPLVGFLAAGFILNALGVSGGDMLQKVADLGVTLLLFTIGLKLKVRDLLEPVVWAGTTLHMVVTIALMSLVFVGFAQFNLALFADLAPASVVLVAFALSFSSTVFAVKVLEDKGEMSSMHGRAAVGMLIMQDVLAVLFLTASSGKVPSPWALVVVTGLLLLRPYLFRIMDRCDHGELVILYGFFLALVVGAKSFDAVAMKADLGALLIGMLIANHPKSKEMAKSLMGFKEIFLVGFFLSIGLAGIPTWQTLGAATLLALAIPLKAAAYFLLLCRFRLRPRSSLLASFSLANYSEFGLIVAAVGVNNGWLDRQWLTVMALALSLTFVMASPLNSLAHGVYMRFRERLARFEVAGRHPDDLVGVGLVNVAIFGMGRIGSGAYDFMTERCGTNVVGVDLNENVVQQQRESGRNVMLGDATDPDFWDLLKTRDGLARLELVMLAMPKHRANLFAAEQLRKAGFSGTIAAIAMYDDQLEELRRAGVDSAFNFYAEAGNGFAEHVYEQALRSGVLPGVCQVPS
ncbi:cation:proton antiporter family protein [Geoalkalibacter sp.]|uniref:cation:proton antiporter family protein n=1 Tax=Geoalkalibacter sp. TaxID=3041440 RepID=UPI00272E2BE7|nr:cation:proton antiporter family protein [Geoalkalibacter sp.]